MAIKISEGRKIEYGLFDIALPQGATVGSVVTNPKYSLETSVEGEYLGCPQCGASGGEEDATFMAGFCIDCGYTGKPAQVRREAQPVLLRVQEIKRVGGSNGAASRSEWESWSELRAICTPVAE